LSPEPMMSDWSYKILVPAGNWVWPMKSALCKGTAASFIGVPTAAQPPNAREKTRAELKTKEGVCMVGS